ncbi:MAG: GNAT family N-acetyltransferase [Gammaproteobacteria bacterium]|nr:GNAT family N-acetyltransferase [Gammaproteobacteria bacterium]MCW8986065.1 GNAT family N-acetyltransferase [Gammaproteobacteria bacterium]MCW9032326.1 GNAT family N-acetyltransferase [Gammaproteobacteria bacterium]
MYKILTPLSQSDFERYYKTRWELLRKPWGQALDSEKDELENESIHRMVEVDNRIIAVGRLHYINKTTAQIRYMAVKQDYEKQGIAKAIYTDLEKEAYTNGIKLITLNSRELATGFYEKIGFTVTKKTNLLFNQIQHYEMQKKL